MKPSVPTAEPQWWETRWFVAFVVLLSALPMTFAEVPPLLDLPGHMGRYRVQLDLAHSPALQQFYRFEWALIGNLGVDLLVELLGPLIGLERAVRLIVLVIPPLTVAGFLWVAREVHGRVPPTALFAAPLAYNFPFWFGFVNFALSMALAFLAFGLWLRLARLGRLRTRAVVFVPISILIWVCHAFGWGTLGVLAFSAELVRQFDKGHHIVPAGFRAAVHCLALAPPVALILLWRQEASGWTGGWLQGEIKLEWLLMSLRDRWELWDVAGFALLTLSVAWALLSFRIGFSRNLGASALFLALVYIALPRIVFGSAYADMRLAPYLVAVALLAVRFPPDTGRRFVQAMAIAGLAFVIARTGGNAVSTWLYDREFRQELQALDHVPHGARMVSFVGRECRQPWAMNRLLHLPGIAIVRRHAFSNDQWTAAGAQLLRVDFPEGRPFTRDASQIVTAVRCRREVWRPIDHALERVPREAFDYVWLIKPPPYDERIVADMRIVWESGTGSVLYEVER